MSKRTHIAFSNNRTEGHGRKVEEVHITTLIDEFLKQQSPEANRPIDVQIQIFITTYKTDSGLRRYAPLTDEEVDTLLREYDAQRELRDE